MVPCTIHLLNTATQPNTDSDSFLLDGQLVSQVSIVGQVMSENPQMTTLAFVVDDGTGVIDVRVYVDPEAQDDYVHQISKAEWTSGKYYRITGNLRSFAKKRSLVANRLMAITDHNELVHHQLEVIHAHLLRTGSKPQGALTTSSSASHYKTSTASANPYVQKPAVQHTDSGLTDLQNQVLEFVTLLY